MQADQLAEGPYPLLDTDHRQVKQAFLLRWERWQIRAGSHQGIICQAVNLWPIDLGPVKVSSRERSAS